MTASEWNAKDHLGARAVKRVHLIQTSVYDKHLGSTKITAHLDHIRHFKTVFGTIWSNRWTYQEIIKSAHPDKIEAYSTQKSGRFPGHFFATDKICTRKIEGHRLRRPLCGMIELRLLPMGIKDLGFLAFECIYRLQRDLIGLRIPKPRNKILNPVDLAENRVGFLARKWIWKSDLTARAIIWSFSQSWRALCFELKSPKSHDVERNNKSNLLEDSIFKFIDFQKVTIHGFSAGPVPSRFEIDKPQNRVSSLVQTCAKNPGFSAFRFSGHKNRPHHRWDS